MSLSFVSVISVAQAARDLDVHENVLRKWVKEFGADPTQAFPGQGQMKPEQQEIERLRREVSKLKAERDILKKNHSLLREGIDMKFVFIAKHRNHLAGGMAMRCNGRVPVGLPCLAEPLAQRQIPQRRSGWPSGEGKLPCQRSYLWRQACLA